jgi:hypothetical protein
MTIANGTQAPADFVLVRQADERANIVSML